MLDPTTLFSWAPDVDPQTVHADTLVVTLGSYGDTGQTQRQIDDQLREHLPTKLLGSFDADQLIDYTAHRPSITFERDHFSHYSPPRIAVHQLTDPAGRSFITLSGPEPAMQWERLAASVTQLVDQLEVRRTIFVQTMPTPAPHTRPVFISRFASDPSLLHEEPVMGTFTLPASFNGLLMLRLGQANHDAIGLLAHIPHYIAETEFPPAAAAILTAIQDATTLELPFDGLESKSARTLASVDRQVADNDELAGAIHTLEERYDQFVGRLPLLGHGAAIPDADELGAQFEQFLASLEDNEGGQ
ncbi:MAG: PAC2 family protein [Arachnia sp.]